MWFAVDGVVRSVDDCCCLLFDPRIINYCFLGIVLVASFVKSFLTCCASMKFGLCLFYCDIIRRNSYYFVAV